MNIAILLAGGVGKRVGSDVPKQFVLVEGKPLIYYSIKTMDENNNIDKIVIVSLKTHINYLKKIISEAHFTKDIEIIEGGRSFADSIQKGVRSLKGKCKDDDVVLIHMSPSAITPSNVIDDAISVCKKYGNAFAAEPESLYVVVKNNNKYESFDRSKLFGLNTPWTFKYEQIVSVLDYGLEIGADLVSNPAFIIEGLIELGIDLHFSRASSLNHKVTTKDDLLLVKSYLMSNKEKPTLNALSIEKIKETFNCSLEDIQNIELINRGFSNKSFSFIVDGKKYLIREPGISASIICDRSKEAIVQNLALEVGIDKTLIKIYDDGYKIAHYIDDILDVEVSYYQDIEFQSKMLLNLKKLHTLEVPDEVRERIYFNPIEAGEKLVSDSGKSPEIISSVFKSIREKMHLLYERLERDNMPKGVTHNDLNYNNILYTKDGNLEIIDWEFGGYADVAFDFGRVIDQYDFDSPITKKLIGVYLEREPSKKEVDHFIGYIGIHAYYYMCWCLYKESIKEDTSFYMTYFLSNINKVLAYLSSGVEEK